jgi:hypothetical protein
MAECGCTRFAAAKENFLYQWGRGHSPHDVELASAPQWLFDWLSEQDQRRTVGVASAVPRAFEGRVSAWARKVIDVELARLANACEGTRNETLNVVSFKLGQLIAGGEADSSEWRCARWALAGEASNRSRLT